MNVSDTPDVIRFRSITKHFPGVVALRAVTFDVRAGECHALVGENGAGKSTLGRILAGVYEPSEGTIELYGQTTRFRSPLDAQRAGVGIVHQELSFCPNLTVAENLCLGDLPRRGPFLDRRTLRSRAQSFLDRIGARCNVDEELGRLPTAQEQMVQIAAALATGARVLVMDEPTSSLSSAETDRLFALIGELRAQGTTILYISHRLDEIFRLCDRVTVLRDGQHVATRLVAETTEDELVRLMIGRALSAYFPKHTEKPPSEELLRVEHLTSPSKFHDISFSLHAGEVLGLAGLVGAGRSEVACALFGLDPEARGKVYFCGEPVTITCPKHAMGMGIGLVPEDRKRQGLIMSMTAGQNMTLPSLDQLRRMNFICRRAETEQIDRYFAQLSIRAASPDVLAEGLSGGNQQKVVLAKWLARRCRVLIVDEPTRGVDVGAKSEIHSLIDSLAAEGNAVLLISSELPEVLNLSTRILVLRAGRLVGELSRSEATQENLMRLMAGVDDLSTLRTHDSDHAS